MLNYKVMLILPTIPKIPLTLIGYSHSSSSFSLKTQKPLKLPEIDNPQKSLSLSSIFTWNHSLSRIFEETVEGSSEEGRKEKEKSPELTEFTPKSQKPKSQGNFFCQMKCDSGYFFDISGLFRGSSPCYGIFSGFLHNGLDELDRGSIVDSIEILS